jgi:hypothetical protein
VSSISHLVVCTSNWNALFPADVTVGFLLFRSVAVAPIRLMRLMRLLRRRLIFVCQCYDWASLGSFQ